MKLHTTKPKNKYDLISISHYFYPRIGGLENVAYSLLVELAKRGKKVIGVHGAEKRYSTSINGFRTESFKTLGLFNNTYPIFYPDFIFYILKLLLQNPRATVIIHSRHLISSLIAATLCIFLNHPFTLVEHNAGPIYLKTKLLNVLVNWLDRNLFGVLFKWAYSIVAVSKTSRRWISRRFKVNPNNIEVIYNGFPGKSIKQTGSNKENIVVWAAKWISVKNPEIALKAFTKLAKSHTDWKFMLIGEGEALKLPPKLPLNLEIIPRLIKYEDMQRLLQKSKVYVNTSISEGLSVGILDGASYGNIPVLSDAPSNVEIAKGIGTDRFVFKRQNLKELVSKINLAMNESENGNLIEAIMRKVKEKFSRRSMVNQYSRLLFETTEKVRKVSIIIPAYNEQKYIWRVLKMVNNVKFENRIQKELIIIDDGSTDSTLGKVKQYIAKYKGGDIIKVFRNPSNLGKSRSVVEGIRYAKGDLIVVHDADLEYNPKDLRKFVNLFKTDPTVAVIYGNRFNMKNRFINPTHLIGNMLLTTLSNLFTIRKGIIVKDMETCYKMGRASVYKSIMGSIESQSNFGIEPELTARFTDFVYKNRRLNIRNIDISYNPRGHQEGKKMQWVKNGIEAVGEIVKYNIKTKLSEARNTSNSSSLKKNLKTDLMKQVN